MALRFELSHSPFASVSPFMSQSTSTIQPASSVLSASPSMLPSPSPSIIPSFSQIPYVSSSSYATPSPTPLADETQKDLDSGDLNSFPELSAWSRRPLLKLTSVLNVSGLYTNNFKFVTW